MAQLFFVKSKIQKPRYFSASFSRKAEKKPLLITLEFISLPKIGVLLEYFLLRSDHHTPHIIFKKPQAAICVHGVGGGGGGVTEDGSLPIHRGGGGVFVPPPFIRGGSTRKSFFEKKKPQGGQVPSEIVDHSSPSTQQFPTSRASCYFKSHNNLCCVAL